MITYPDSGFQNKTPVSEIIKYTFGGSKAKQFLVGCFFELNQTCTYPPSNSIMWLLMPSYVASGNKAIFQLLISSPFSTHPARITYSSRSESSQKRDFFFFLLAKWFPTNNPFCKTHKYKSSVPYNQHKSEEIQDLGAPDAKVLCVVIFNLCPLSYVGLQLFSEEPSLSITSTLSLMLQFMLEALPRSSTSSIRTGTLVHCVQPCIHSF